MQVVQDPKYSVVIDMRNDEGNDQRRYHFILIILISLLNVGQFQLQYQLIIEKKKCPFEFNLFEKLQPIGHSSTKLCRIFFKAYSLQYRCTLKTFT